MTNGFMVWIRKNANGAFTKKIYVGDHNTVTEKIQETLTIPPDLAGLRLDKALATLLPKYSRTQIQKWIKENNVQINHQPAPIRLSVLGGEEVTISAERK